VHVQRRPLIITLACAALGVVVYLLASYVPFVTRLDVDVMARAIAHQTPERASLATSLVDLFNPGPFALFTCLIVAGAIAAGRIRAGLTAGAAVIGAVISAEALKHLLAVQRPFPADHYMPAGSWPSAHTTAAVSLLLALVIVLPAHLRRPVAIVGGLGVAFALGSIVLMGFHYPSDVVGGILLATGWAAAGFAVSGSARAPRAARSRRRSHPATG
jgi:membrane-associated phospholipid phosphatase